MNPEDSGNVVAALTNQESLFAVLAAAARRRSNGSLALQLTACLGAASLILVEAPQWWSIAALIGVPASYSAWGLVARDPKRAPKHAFFLRGLALMVAVTGTALAIAGLVGLAFALFTGNGRSPYNACGPGATTPMCESWANPPKSPLPFR